MKKILIIATMLLTLTSIGQTTINQNLVLSQNSNLTTTGLETNTNGNCGVLNGNITINGNLDLNNQTLFLKQNTNLVVNGTITNGIIISCNNQNHNNTISVCANNITNVELNGINCNNNLSITQFQFSKDYGLKYKVYDMLGRLRIEGITNQNTLNEMPKNEILIIKVDTFKDLKFINN